MDLADAFAGAPSQSCEGRQQLFFTWPKLQHVSINSIFRGCTKMTLECLRNFRKSFVLMTGVATVGLSVTVHADIIFQDGFEGGNLAASANGFKWTQATSTSVVSTYSKSDSRSLQFFYKATADLRDSWAEQRFYLGKNYKDIWISYDLRVPDNYYHRNQSDGSSNNKGFIYMWSGDYSSPTGPLLGPEFWANSDGSSKGSIRLFGQGYDKHFWSACPSTIKLSDRGKWIRIVSHLKYASSANNDGIVQIWKIYEDGTRDLSCSITNGAWYVANAPGFDSGYLLGWSNSGFSADTSFYIDNVTFATHSLLEAEVPVTQPSPPVAPSLMVTPQ